MTHTTVFWVAAAAWAAVVCGLIVYLVVGKPLAGIDEWAKDGDA